MFALVRQASAFKQELNFVIESENRHPVNDAAIDRPLDPEVCSFFPICQALFFSWVPVDHQLCDVHIIPYQLNYTEVIE
jgi:hypothetical protein